MELCDGLILEGGLTSSFYEEEVARYAYNNNVPILGICSGQRHQITAFGGDNQLIKGDIDRHNDYENELVHEVLIKKDSYFYSIVGAEKIMVNSYHENISYNTGIYEAVGYSDDGLIEVTELKNKTFNIGVRFHPELLFKKDKKMNNIFTEFIKFCKKYQDNKLNLVSNKK